LQYKTEEFLKQCCSLIDVGKVDPFTQNLKTKSTCEWQLKSLPPDIELVYH